MKSLKARKAAVTREIKEQESYIADLKDVAKSQGDKYFVDHYNGVETIKMERWMYLGEFFFPKTIRREEAFLEGLRSERKALDKEVEVKPEIIEEVVVEVSIEEALVKVDESAKKRVRLAMVEKIDTIEKTMNGLGCNDFSVDFRYRLEKVGLTIQQFDEVLLSLEEFYTMDRHRVILARGVINFLAD